MPRALHRWAGGLALTGLVAGCGVLAAAQTPGVEAGPTPTPPVATALTPTATPTSPPTGPPTAGSADPAGPAAQELAVGLDIPWGLALLPGGDALVGERDGGRLLRVPAGGGPATQVGRLPIKLALDEGGLLGLAVSPQFARDRSVYAYLTTPRDNRVVRLRLDRPGRLEPVLRGIRAAPTHNGGRIAFGPDGMLYVTTGDGNDPDLAQDRRSLNGKILRLRPDGSPAPGNPFPGSPVYSYGHRNVQGLAWDGAGRLYATEFGQQAVDEINRIVPGGNYGWPEVEGRGPATGGRRNPLLTWPTQEASPSGAVILGSTLYVAGLRGERLWAVPLDGAGGVGRPRPLLQGRYGRLRTLAGAPDGSLWLTTSNRDNRGRPRPGDDRLLRLSPTQLAAVDPVAAR